MTEAEWLASTDPAAMLDLATLKTPGLDWSRGLPHISGRRLRLFAVACCRACWPLLTDGRIRGAVETAERFADGLATEEERGLACAAAMNAEMATRSHAADAAWCLVGTAIALETANQVSRLHTLLYADQYEARCIQANLVLEIIGNPYRPVTLPNGPAVKCKRCEGDGWVCSDDGWGARDQCKVCEGKGTLGLFGPCPWLTWNNGLVPALARAAYEERGRKCKCREWEGVKIREGFDAVQAVIDWGRRKKECPDCYGTGRNGDGHLDAGRLAVLCDALEDADCTDKSILGHLRSPGPHVRGCWVLDLILGKE